VEIRFTHLSGSRAGTVESFHRLPVVLGRAPTCHVLFDAEADPQVSAVHAELRRGPGGIEVVDKESKNGLRLDGVPVSGSALLPRGGLLELGAGGPKVKVEVDEAGGVSFADVQRQTARRRRQETRRIISTIESIFADVPEEPAGPSASQRVAFGDRRTLLLAVGITLVLIGAAAGALLVLA
jgi:hypothetical protein